MAMLLTERPMLVDQIEHLARRVGVDTTPPAGMSCGYQCSYAGWLLGQIEFKVGSPGIGQLGVRFRKANAMALAMEPLA